ncbi:phosphoesterase [Anaerotruncus sp. CAG:390]|nr:phosphoesterase [Anaerotruncus sp. CAG:390]
MKITPYSVVLGLPAPLRFAVVADMHARPAPGLPELILSEKPDALLMPGDIFDTRGSREDALTFLGAMAAKLPVFCSFGNHDRHMKDDDRAELDRIGVRVLDNTAVTFRGLTIGGLTSGFFTEYRTDLEKTPAARTSKKPPHRTSCGLRSSPPCRRRTCFSVTIRNITPSISETP